MNFKTILSTVILLLSMQFLLAQDEPEVILWEINNLESIGGHPVTLYGNPAVIDTDSGPAVEFDGVDDGLLVESNPLAGAEEFTVEILFKPYSGGLEEQRFVHFQQDNDNRALIELRSTPEGKWFLDTFIKAGTSNCVLYAENHLHDADQWQHAALVFKNDTMMHYVNGELELSDTVAFVPVSSGGTSLGVRQNLVSWYKGAIHTLKVTHKALEPEGFLINQGGGNTGINTGDLTGRTGFMLYPNPARDHTMLSYSLFQEGMVALELYNMQSSRVAMFVSENQAPGNYSQRIDLSELRPGMYFYSLKRGKETSTGKFLLVN